MYYCKKLNNKLALDIDFQLNETSGFNVVNVCTPQGYDLSQVSSVHPQWYPMVRLDSKPTVTTVAETSARRTGISKSSAILWTIWGLWVVSQVFHGLPVSGTWQFNDPHTLWHRSVPSSVWRTINNNTIQTRNTCYIHTQVHTFTFTFTGTYTHT